MSERGYGFTLAEEIGNKKFAYRAYNTEGDIYKEISERSPAYRNLYEKIPLNKPSRLYLDFEWEYKDSKEYPSAQKPKSQEEYLTGALTYLRGFMGKYYAIDIDPSQLLVSGACSPGIKISFHVLLPW